MLLRWYGLQAQRKTAANIYQSRTSTLRGQHNCRSIGKQTTRMSASLPRRKLGKTEYDVCPLGFGASPLGSIYSVCANLTNLPVLVSKTQSYFAIQEMSEGVAIETVHEAFRQGINYFDTSPFYGDGLSETVRAKFTQLS